MQLSIDAKPCSTADFQQLCDILKIVQDYNPPANISIDDGFGNAVISTSADFLSFPSILIAGSRQVGKTTLLHQLLRSALAVHPYCKIIILQPSGLNEFEEFEPNAGIIYDANECLDFLDGLSITDSTEKIFVAIDNYHFAMLSDHERFISALRRIIDFRVNAHIFMTTNLTGTTAVGDDILQVFPTRIVFRLQDIIDSRRIVGTDEATTLEFQSEFLLYNAGEVIRYKNPQQ